jgi:amino acid adenylation domain-containing protein
VPLSFSQERLWFLDQLAPGSHFYAESSAIKINTAIMSELLERSINSIVARHEILRARFDMRGGQPVQIAEPTLYIPLVHSDLSALSLQEQNREVERLALEHAMRPFDLRRSPLLRTQLLKLSPTNFIFLLTIHHIISDGWSMGIFAREVSECYNGLVRGRPVEFPPLPIQYFDYATWQRTTLQGAVLDAELHFWRQQLHGLPAIELPLVQPRPRILTYAGSHLEVQVPANLSAGLRVLCRREQVTLFMGALAIFAIVLRTYTSQTDLAIGTPVAGRSRTELEPLIGVFLNSVVLRIDISGNPTYRELLKRVKSVCMAAYDHQDVPFERVVEELQPERNLGKNPLFQVLFQLFTPPTEKAGAASAQPDIVAVDRGTAILDLAWHLTDSPEGIRGRLEFSTELFEPQTVSAIFEHFVRMLAEVITHPDRRLSDLNLITPSEQQKLLHEWQGPVDTNSPQRCMQLIFEEQVAAGPDCIALIEGESTWTFRALQVRTNQLAHYLIQRGIRPGDRVAICLSRSAVAVIAALGAIKAGAVYVPLDPAYPVSRLRYMLEDSRAALVLSDRAHADTIATAGPPVILLDGVAHQEIAAQSSNSPQVFSYPLDAAYLIYTSGSTGRPKGVVGLHGATVNRFQWMWDEFPFGRDEVACQRTALSFVDSIWEMFGPILAGVPLVVIPDEVARNADRLIAILARHKVTRLLTVPSLLATLLEAGIDLASSVPDLHLWFASGERLPIEVVRRFRSLLPGRTLVNLYGSSEVAGDILCEPIIEDARVRIGRPIRNSCAYVLNEFLQLVPPGVAGDLWVAGRNLCRGYFNRAALTAERFVPDPFSSEPGSRMYATGDRARHLPDGRIEYLGRTDNQIKLRGFRIELGEIENALREHPSVLTAAAVVHDDDAGGRLVAYVVRESGFDEPEELRQFLRLRLPAHMIPGSIVWLDELPLTPNGKLNRALLPAVENLAAPEYVPPRTDAEQAVARIWTDLLRVGRVSMTDGFFELGGHSLLAIRLVSRIREELGVEVSVREVFLHATAGEFAALIERRLLEEIEHLTDEEARRQLAAGLG